MKTRVKSSVEVNKLPQQKRQVSVTELKSVKGGKKSTTVDFEKFGKGNDFDIGRKSAS